MNVGDMVKLHNMDEDCGIGVVIKVFCNQLLDESSVIAQIKWLKTKKYNEIIKHYDIPGFFMPIRWVEKL